MERIDLLEHQRRDLDRALEELRRIYSGRTAGARAVPKAKTTDDRLICAFSRL